MRFKYNCRDYKAFKVGHFYPQGGSFLPDIGQKQAFFRRPITLLFLNIFNYGRKKLCQATYDLSENINIITVCHLSLDIQGKE